MSASMKTDNFVRKHRLYSNNLKPNETTDMEPVEKKSKEGIIEKMDDFHTKCDVCNIEFNSELSAAEHFKGKKHAKRFSVQVTSEQRSPVKDGGIHDNTQHGNNVPSDQQSHIQHGNNVPRDQQSHIQHGSNVPRDDQSQTQHGSNVSRDQQSHIQHGSNVPRDDQSQTQHGRNVPRDEQSHTQHGRNAPRDEQSRYYPSAEMRPGIHVDKYDTTRATMTGPDDHNRQNYIYRNKPSNMQPDQSVQHLTAHHRGDSEAYTTPQDKPLDVNEQNRNERAKYLQQNNYYDNHRPPKQDLERMNHNDVQRDRRGSNPLRDDQGHHRLGNTQYEYYDPRNTAVQSSSSSYTASQHYKKNHPTSSSGDSIALKNFYGASLESYFNPPESDICGVLPDNLEAEQHDDNHRDSNDLHSYASFPNNKTSQSQMNTNSSEGYFNSSNTEPHKDMKQLQLKNFYGSTLESYFNPPENDYCNQLPDKLKSDHGRNDSEDNRDIDFYGGKIEHEKDNYTLPVAEDPDSYHISSLDDLLRNPPDNLEADEAGDDFDNADSDCFITSDHKNPEQEDSTNYEEDTREMDRDAVPDDYYNSRETERDNPIDSSHKRSNSPEADYRHNNYKDCDSYSNTADRNSANSDYANQSNRSHDHDNRNNGGNNYANRDGSHGNDRSKSAMDAGVGSYSRICEEIKNLKDKLTNI